MRRECFCEVIYRVDFWRDIPVDMSTEKRTRENSAQYFICLLKIFIFSNKFPSTCRRESQNKNLLPLITR
jgi:hypothetical protein